MRGTTPPVIEGIANETFIAGSTHDSTPLVINDTESAESILTLSATSSTSPLVPVASIVFGGPKSRNSPDDCEFNFPALPDSEK